ncbi:hypothetical protein [Kordia sp.]|uniref:hypothetical protein n=1 Tax=Kordia sp. TaxID=1965332 RepID=UPI003D6C4D93
MKKLLLTFLCITSVLSTAVASHQINILETQQTTPEKTFCDGWEDGYEDGFTYHSIQNRRIKPIFTTPTCPISKIGFDTYQDGYNCGLIQGKKDFKKRDPTVEDDGSHPIAIPARDIDDERSFCQGWKNGFEVGYTYYYVINRRRKPFFTTPICPVAKIDNDNYQAGYNRGLLAGRDEFQERNPDLETSEEEIHIYQKKRKKRKKRNNKKDKRSYCDGWEDGYEDGYTHHNSVNGGIKPIFITPICPISKIGYDTYQDGYDRGRKKGLKDFKKR